MCFQYTYIKDGPPKTMTHPLFNLYVAVLIRQAQNDVPTDADSKTYVLTSTCVYAGRFGELS